MKIPRNVGGKELAKALSKYGYFETRQVGSHIRLTTTLRGEHHITIPAHKPLRIGTLNNILSDVSSYLEITKEQLVKELFG